MLGILGTLIALITAAVMYLHYGQESNAPLNIDPFQLGILLIIPATAILFLASFLLARTWGTLQRAEQYLTPRILELFKKDFSLKLARGWLYLFPLATYLLAIAWILQILPPTPFLIALWIIALGTAIDTLTHLMKRVYGYLDPFHVADTLEKEARKSIQNDRELDFYHWGEALTEVAIKAVQRHSTSLCNHVDNQIQGLTDLFLKSAKSIGHREKDMETAASRTDVVSYTLFFLLQRLEMISHKAVEQRLEPVCSNMITALGKITLSAAEYDLSMPSYPMHYLGRIALSAQRNGLTEVGPKAVYTLLEVGKQILNTNNVQYAEIQNTYVTLTRQLTLISQEIFKQDKNISIPLLIQPFKDLRTLFTTEKMAAHQDTPAILSAIDSAIGEFEALALVMRTIPPINPPNTP